MGPEERYWRRAAALYRAAPVHSLVPRSYMLSRARECDHNADLLAIEDGLSLAEVESLQRLCRRDCPDALAAEGRG